MEAGRQLCVLAHSGSWAAPGAGCKLVQFRAAMRYILSSASGHNVWAQIGGKQPKKRKSCHSLHPNSVLRTAPACLRIQHWESWPRLSFSRQTQHFFCTFFRPDARKALCCPSAGQGCAAAWLQALLSPFACLWQPVRMLPLPWWELQSHGTLLSAAMLGIQLRTHRFFHPSRAHTQNPWVIDFHRNQKLQELPRAHPVSSKDRTVCNLACLWYTKRSPRKPQSDGKGCCVMGTTLAIC